MRIGIDAHGIQSPHTRGRGIGRYARHLVEALLERAEHEFLLFVDPRLPTEDIPAGGIVVTLKPFDGPLGGWRALQKRLDDDVDRLDAFLTLSPIEGHLGHGAPNKPRHDLPMAAVLHDFIRFLDPIHYLADPAVALTLGRHLHALASYDLLLTNSEATRLDTLRLLPVAPERVRTIGAGRTPFFDEPGAYRNVLGLDRPYVLNVGGVDVRKNIPFLIDAFAALPESLRSDHRLVIACLAPEPLATQLKARACAAGIEDRLVLTGEVSDETLRDLYQGCAAFAFPSRYEGFGFPLLEAMQSGAAVVAGNGSSLPEVVGEAGLLADAEDVRAFSSALARVLVDMDLRRELGWRARERTRLFDWQRVADLTLSALREQAPPTSSWRPLDLETPPGLEPLATIDECVSESPPDSSPDPAPRASWLERLAARVKRPIARRLDAAIERRLADRDHERREREATLRAKLERLDAERETLLERLTLLEAMAEDSARAVDRLRRAGLRVDEPVAVHAPKSVSSTHARSRDRQGCTP